ncbi:hypothetical protein SAMN05216559_2097 [Halomicrobium zhouii]|uniref:Lipoprotein n=1 Tax=Halomicrobium zhouii TaxID=767519 RepID=A0A1I6L5M0_9EURY|nr:Hvo_1808 family surface protein [Halomicrobium zhouii]SFR98775.1 hypothetical protein SAMN05216559_2097 [Halomicrobium zhouii]
MRRGVVVLVGVAVLAILAGCSGIDTALHQPLEQDPATDQIGWENGYWYDESISVTTEDGLNESEREAVLARTMARVEQIRGLEFEGNVTLEVISRDEYRNRSTGLGVSGDPWNEQVWEGLLLVGEDRQVENAFGDTFNSSVQGYYAPANDSIVIVSDSETPTIDRGTLAHELVHALQDQEGGLAGSPPTQDRQLASQSVTEGEANYVQAQYRNRCDSGRWQCLEKPPRGASGGGQATDGVFLVIYQPYATGPEFVAQVRQSGGWDAVTELYDTPPNSTEQVIHPEKYPGEQPANVTVPDRSSDEWSRFDHDPVADTVGEASIYGMLTVHGEAEVPRDEVYEYESRPSAGWAGDALVPYHNGSGDGADAAGYGYVWETRWDTERDARQFESAYRSILEGRAAERPGENVYVLPESDPYGDAFRVVRDGQRVTIVNAPSRAELSDIHSRSSG